jgi:hypothetical protein
VLAFALINPWINNKIDHKMTPIWQQQLTLVAATKENPLLLKMQKQQQCSAPNLPTAPQPRTPGLGFDCCVHSCGTSVSLQPLPDRSM